MILRNIYIACGMMWLWLMPLPALWQWFAPDYIFWGLLILYWQTGHMPWIMLLFLSFWCDLILGVPIGLHSFLYTFVFLSGIKLCRLPDNMILACAHVIGLSLILSIVHTIVLFLWADVWLISALLSQFISNAMLAIVLVSAGFFLHVQRNVRNKALGD